MHCPLKIICLAERNASFALEQILHKKCKPYSVHGEWYNDVEQVRHLFFSEYDPYPSCVTGSDADNIKRMDKIHSMLAFTMDGETRARGSKWLEQSKYWGKCLSPLAAYELEKTEKLA